MGSFKREFDGSALIVHTKSQLLIRLEKLAFKDPFIDKVCGYSSTQEINDGF